MSAAPDTGPPDERRRPAPPQSRPSRNATYGGNSNRLYRPEDGHAAPTAEDRREADLLAEVRGLGYCIAVSCRVCGHPLTALSSVARHIGPKCAAKAVRR